MFFLLILNFKYFLKILESYKDRILPTTHELYKIVIKVAERLCVSNLDLQQMKDIQWKVFIIEEDDFNAHVYPVNRSSITFIKNFCFLKKNLNEKALFSSPE